MTRSGCHCSLLRPREPESHTPNPPAKPHQTAGLKQTPPQVITPIISQRGGKPQLQQFTFMSDFKVIYR